MADFLKGSQEIRLVIEYHMFYFPPRRRSGDPVQSQAEFEDYPDASGFPGYPEPGQCFRDMCFSPGLQIPARSGEIVRIRTYQDRVNVDRIISLLLSVITQ